MLGKTVLCNLLLHYNDANTFILQRKMVGYRIFWKFHLLYKFSSESSKIF